MPLFSFEKVSLAKPIFIGLLFLTTLTLARLIQKKMWPVVKRSCLGIKNNPLPWLQRLPVNPLVLKCTQADFFKTIAYFYPYKKYFTYPVVLRYKELSCWLTLLLVGIFFIKLPFEQALILSAASIVTALRWPEWLLTQQDKEIKRKAERDLPAIIDLLRLFVSAGQNLESALRHVATPNNGWWGFFFKEFVFQLDAGKSFDKTLSDSSDRLSSSDYSRFVIALKQAQTLGVPLSTTLSVQASLLRARRRQNAEALARQASVKIALPLALCIFPALLIIYLTPAVLRLVNDL